MAERPEEVVDARAVVQRVACAVQSGAASLVEWAVWRGDFGLGRVAGFACGRLSLVGKDGVVVGKREAHGAEMAWVGGRGYVVDAVRSLDDAVIGRRGGMDGVRRMRGIIAVWSVDLRVCVVVE